MSKKMPNIYLIGIAVITLAMAVTGFAIGEEIIYVLWILEAVILFHYPNYVRQTVHSETLSTLVRWNTRIHIVHMLLGISVCIPIYYILAFGKHMVWLGATIIFILYCIGVALARVNAVKSIRILLRFAVENQLCTPHFAKVHTILHAIPIVCLFSAFTVKRQLKQNPSNS